MEHIIEQRRTAAAKKPVLVRWKGYGPEYDTWEPMETLKDCAALGKWLHPTASVTAYEVGRALRIETNQVGAVLN